MLNDKPVRRDELDEVKKKTIWLTACCFKSDGLEFVNIFCANKVAILRSVDRLHYAC